jgi:allophanate hydrolase
MTETVLPATDGGIGPAGVSLAELRTAYQNGRVTPSALVGQVLRRIAERDDSAWISLRGEAELLATARRLEDVAARDGIEHLPLYGVPVAVKDSIDVAGLPTTLACPDFAYVPDTSATAVRRLEAAGAFVVGKTNLDQFATGLNGTRSPYGVPRSVYGGDLISGGSSSGSAVAVASGCVPVAIATDTAGSGRVPAAMNGIVGLKPTPGMISTAGLVPACRSADCVTVMASRVDDAMAVYDAVAAPDPGNPWSRPEPRDLTAPSTARPPRLGLPAPVALEFFGDDVMRDAHLAARAHAAARLGADTVDVDLAPFHEAGDLLYGGPWVAERDADLGDFIRANPDSVLPVIRDIIVGGPRYSAVDTFRAQHRVTRLRHEVRTVWEHTDALLLPTVGTTFTVAEILADPVDRNTMLGHYTRFGNLLDLAAIAFPAGTTPDGRPLSLMLVGPARSDRVLADLAGRVLGESALAA